MGSRVSADCAGHRSRGHAVSRLSFGAALADAVRLFGCGSPPRQEHQREHNAGDGYSGADPEHVVDPVHEGHPDGVKQPRGGELAGYRKAGEDAAARRAGGGRGQPGQVQL
jgi:hypothetical protein